MKQVKSGLLVFTRNERRGILILVLLIIIINSLPFIKPYFFGGSNSLIEFPRYSLVMIDSLHVKNTRDSFPRKYFNKNARPSFFTNSNQNQKSKQVSTIDINAADSIAWMDLPGIGPKLSGRIVAFREKLGGFYSVEQVSETFGLKDSVFKKIKYLLRIGNGIFRYINVNTDSLQVLSAHPYIRYRLGKYIIDYRRQHGNFSKKDDLLNIMLITPEELEKMKPYIRV